MMAQPASRRIRRVHTPSRELTRGCVVASRSTEGSLHLESTAASVWEALAEWASEPEVIDRIAQQHPEVDDREIEAAVHEILEMLESEGLLELAAA